MSSEDTIRACKDKKYRFGLSKAELAPRIARLLLLAFTCIGCIGLSVAQTTPPPSNQQPSPKKLPLQDEGHVVSTTQVPLANDRVRPRPYLGGGLPPGCQMNVPQNCVNSDATDVAATAASGETIQQATGSFVSSSTSIPATNGEYGLVGSTKVYNDYSIQLNTNNTLTTNLCSNAKPPINTTCMGWEQFVFYNRPSANSTATPCGMGTVGCIFFMYELQNYTTTGDCSALNVAGGALTWFNNGTKVDCYAFGPHLTVGMEQIANLSSITLTGTMGDNFGNNDTMKICDPNWNPTCYPLQGDNPFPSPNNWNTAEFNVLGDPTTQGVGANFATGTQITPKINLTYQSRLKKAAGCTVISYTNENNNLGFGPASPPNPGAGPVLIFTESLTGSTTPLSPPMCAPSWSLTDTHLHTFLGLDYDFQAFGDFVLAQVDPNFIVQTRQVSGAPTWQANTAVNHGIATQMGQDRVAVCWNNPDIRPATLNVNGQELQLGDGKLFSTPNGVQIFQVGQGVGQRYIIRDQSGNSVSVTVNSTWLDAAVGLGQWPVNVIGPLANANGNVNQIATSGGTVLTAPFPFAEFYQSYVESWRVPPDQSLLQVCGGSPNNGNPQIPFYAKNLDPQTYQSSRAVCTAAGVTGALLDDCTLDVAAIGDDAAAQVYVNIPQPVAVGYIFIDPNQ